MLPAWYKDFWSGPTVCKAQVSWFRRIFFALLAIDAFLMVGHAPRYGSGGFNVPHFPGLAPITPILDRTAVVVLALVLCYLAARMAIGSAIRWLPIPIAALYGILYFSSQVDSYQHHYLLVLMLVGCSMIDWKSEKPGGIRLLLVQVSIVYLFAAVSKMESAWWDGQALEIFFADQTPNAALDAVKWIGFGTAAKLIVLSELFLAIAIQVRVLRIPAAIVGIGLHAGIELPFHIFEIGLFSYYMIGFYLLVLPASLFRWSELPTWKWTPPGPALAYLGIAAVAGLVVVGTLPLDGAWIAAVVIAAALASALGADNKRATAIAHLAAIMVIVGCAQLSDAIRDHYRFWGGSSRRLGDTETATRAYERLAELEPDYAPGRRNLGRLYLAAGELDKALAQYQAAVDAEPRAVASHLGLATAHARRGDGALAHQHASKALELAKTDPKRDTPAFKQAIRQATAIERRFRGAL